MRKGKSRTQAARHDIMRLNAKNAARKAYDHRRYDGFGSGEALAVEA